MATRSETTRDAPADAGWQARAAVEVTPGLEPVELPSALMHEVFAHAREAYPEESCGLVLAAAHGAELRYVRCTNVQSQRFARGESELDARHGFWIDEHELLVTLRAAEARGETLFAIAHSHVDAPAYLSHTDLQGALGPAGEPLWPGALQLVVSVYDGAAREAACFAFEAESRAFIGRRVARRG